MPSNNSQWGSGQDVVGPIQPSTAFDWGSKDVIDPTPLYSNTLLPQNPAKPSSLAQYTGNKASTDGEVVGNESSTTGQEGNILRAAYYSSTQGLISRGMRPCRR
jgi:hypothetical protein